MTTEAQSVLRHSRAYAAGSVVSMGAGLVVVPILARSLPPADYGTLGVITVAGEIIGAIAGLKLGTAMSRLYFDRATEAERFTVVSTTLLTVLGVVAGLGLMAVLLANGAAGALLGSAGTGDLLLLGVWGLLLNTVFSVGLQHLQIRQRSGLYLLATVGRGAVYVLLNLVLVSGLGFGLRGALWALLATNAALAAVLSAPILLHSGRRFSWRAFKDLTWFSLPMLPGQIAEISVVFADRVLVARLASVAEAGVLFLAFRFSTLLNALLIGPFGRAYVMRRFAAHGSGRPDDEAARVFTTFFFVLTGAALALALFAPWIVVVVAGAPYGPAARVIPLAALTQVLVSLLLIVELGLFYSKRAIYFTYANLAMIAVHVPVGAALIPRFGAVGAAAAGCVSMSVRVALTVYLAKGLGGPRPEWRRVGVILGAAVAAWAAGGLWEHDVPGVLGRAALMTAFVASGLFSPLFTAAERSWILNVPLRWRRPPGRGFYATTVMALNVPLRWRRPPGFQGAPCPGPDSEASAPPDGIGDAHPDPHAAEEAPPGASEHRARS